MTDIDGKLAADLLKLQRAISNSPGAYHALRILAPLDILERAVSALEHRPGYDGLETIRLELDAIHQRMHTIADNFDAVCHHNGVKFTKPLHAEKARDDLLASSRSIIDEAYCRKVLAEEHTKVHNAFWDDENGESLSETIDEIMGGGGLVSGKAAIAAMLRLSKESV